MTPDSPPRPDDLRTLLTQHPPHESLADFLYALQAHRHGGASDASSAAGVLALLERPDEHRGDRKRQLHQLVVHVVERTASWSVAELEQVRDTAERIATERGDASAYQLGRRARALAEWRAFAQQTPFPDWCEVLVMDLFDLRTAPIVSGPQLEALTGQPPSAFDGRTLVWLATAIEGRAPTVAHFVCASLRELDLLYAAERHAAEEDAL